MTTSAKAAAAADPAEVPEPAAAVPYETHPSPAYHCGRLLAVLQHVQALADGQVRSTYSDRYFGAASASPASVLPRIYGLARHRLRNVRGYGAKSDLEATLIRIHAAVGERFPRFLPITQRGEFQLGYFHQTAAVRRAAGGRQRLPTARGEMVQSDGERLIANDLFGRGEAYEYEPRFLAREKDGSPVPVYPDFRVTRPGSSRALLIEYLGLLDDPEYETGWNWKRSRYRETPELRLIEELANHQEPTAVTLLVLKPDDLYRTRDYRETLDETLKKVFRDVPAAGAALGSGSDADGA